MADITIETTHSTGTSLVTDIRGHKIVVDRPEAKGGGDLGPMGGELFLTALAGCFMSNFLPAGTARGLDVSEAGCSVTGRLVEAPPRFEDIEITVWCDALTPEELQHLVVVAERGCIVANTLMRGVSYHAVTRPADSVGELQPE